MKIRDAELSDLPSIRTLLPELVAFEVPAGRQAEEFWSGDYKIFKALLETGNHNGFALVVEVETKIVATSLVSFRKELLSEKPSSHLEVIVVHSDYRGTGLAGSLMQATENRALAGGAGCMTLHAYHQNLRARTFYDNIGFTGEFIRYRKELG